MGTTTVQASKEAILTYFPSLGELMRTRKACETAECLRELERKAAQMGDCAERDLLLVQDFFHGAILQFANCILARTEVRPVVLGRNQNVTIASILQSFRWKSGSDIRDEGHVYNPVWKSFRTWCDENELQPRLELYRDSSGKEIWHTLTVIASPPEAPARGVA
jgi:hypothetical protein